MSTALRPSACPGLLRIVQALDGGICRIKLNGGSISADQADVVADAAERFAGGVIEATNRGNLQIRGIGQQSAELIDLLLAAGLGPKSAAGDDVRNLMLSPAAGIDRQMHFDTRVLAEQILDTLQSHPRFHELSAKFAVQLDGGEALAMLEHPHDLWLSAFEREGETLVAFGLAGCPTGPALGAVALENAHALVVAVLELFLDLARPEHTRMRHLLDELPISAFLEQLKTRVQINAVIAWQRAPAAQGLHIGAYPQTRSGEVYVGAVPPLGRLDPSMLRGIARLARQFGDATLRFTPWQSLLLPNVKETNASAVLKGFERLNLLSRASEPLAHLIACTGSAGCVKGVADTKQDAGHLATLLPSALDVHLSGCRRSCAAAHCASTTLLAVSPGHYDLYFRDAAQPGFGALHARNLTIEAAATLLAGRARSPIDA
ncbi:precorrin-3B synthase [Pseudomonas sp. PB106]|uniref:precorrin-3B synthase n=1 Tax=Pseudomonas sp. PB106 TaxID=2494699 RepID=UPI00131C08CA|nr:precorrin-3B synthase [Pseudomonas sp. PB106]KAE9648926.1 precorrin-3B synthase [Pseudomonas sp. PB106]